jgi:hypothetical protein
MRCKGKLKFLFMHKKAKASIFRCWMKLFWHPKKSQSDFWETENSFGISQFTRNALSISQCPKNPQWIFMIFLIIVFSPYNFAHLDDGKDKVAK